MSAVMQELYDVIISRKDSADEKSYTAYLFREGLDKILKKVGEESSETIIAAKSLQAVSASVDLPSTQTGKPIANENEVAAQAGTSTKTRESDSPTPQLNEASAREDVKNETADLIYHLFVMLADRGIEWSEVESVLAGRAAKSGNLKTIKNTDKNT